MTRENLTSKTSKTNPVGLKALAKLVVFGSNDLDCFSESEKMFVDFKKSDKTNILIQKLTVYLNHLRKIKSEYLAYKFQIKVSKLISADFMGFSAPLGIKSIFKTKTA